MEAKIKLIISQDEFDEHCKEYQALNGNLPTIEQVKETFIDWFMSNKNDYIDRHCDIDITFGINNNLESFNKVIDEIKEYIKNSEPVRYGQWVEVNRTEWYSGDGNVIDVTVEEKCSHCGRYIERYSTSPKENYCPSCGTKMKGEKDA